MINASYHQGKLGWWLMTHWQTSSPLGHHLLMLPPFAEESNRSRRLFSQLAQQLSEQGWNCYLPDFYGTGDSEGEFKDADLELWEHDLCRWILQVKFTQPLHLLACRFGALQLLRMWPALTALVKTGKILLWQPQLDSQKFLQQLLRQHQASRLLQTEKSATAAQLLADGSAVEIAGYSITPEFYQQLALMLPNLQLWQQQTVCWLELSTLPHLPLPATKAWQQIDADPRHSRQQLLALPPFWLQQEHLPAEALISLSLQFLTDHHDD